MADIDQFILAITNEAMDKVCYETTGGNSGWNLRPYQFAISETDVLAQFTEDEIFNTDGSVKPEIYDYLQKLTTQDLKDDSVNIWCELPFSGVTKIGSETDEPSGMGTLSHHVVIPADLTIAGQTKLIKTIYYIYMDNRGVPFLYAIARANTYMIYEAGLTQKYFFDFTVANAYALATTTFVVNYSYPLEIQDHNNSEEAHHDLVKRDGSRSLTGIFEYDENHTPITKNNQLVDKSYVDNYVAENATVEVIDRNKGTQVQGNLEQVIKHTASSWSSTTSTPENQLHLVPYGLPPLAYYNTTTIAANVATNMTKNGIFYVSSPTIAAMTTVIKLNGVTHTLVTYGFNAIIQSGMTFTSNVAGVFIPYIGQ